MFLSGDTVQIAPSTVEARKFWAFVDGWIGTVRGINNGHIEVEAQGKIFFVQPENLKKVSR